MPKKKKHIHHSQDSNVFQLLMFRYYPYWPLFAASAVIMLLIAWVYLRVVTPVYEAKATLLIKDERKGVENTGVVESLNVYNSKKIVENEMEVIKSRSLLKETVGVLHLASPIMEDGVLFAIPAYTTSPVMIEVKDLDVIVEKDRVEFSYDETTRQVEFEGNQYELDTWVTTKYGEIRFVNNPYRKGFPEGQLFVSFINPNRVIEKLLKNLNVLPSNKLSTVVNLSLVDSDPTRAENILNTLMDSYNRATINDKNSVASNTLDFLENRITLVERELDSLEHQIELYKTTNRIVDLSEQGKVFLKNVGDNDQRLSELNMQLAALDRVEEYVIQKDHTEKLVPTTVGLNDGGLSALIKKLYDSEIEYARLRQTTAENNPIVASLRNEIESMRPGILENIQNQKASLSASRANLTSTNSRYASMLETIPLKEKELLEATRQQAIKNNVYTFLLQRREETALAALATEADSRLVDKAESSIDPVSPKPLFVYLGAIAIAIAASMAWVVKKEILGSTVLFRKEIEEHTKIPIAAEISDSEMKSYIVIDNFKKPYLTEQFAQLRAATGLFGNAKQKTVMVTSAVSGEGKSFISANFAVSLAGSNKRVLVVDLDLRNPRLSRLYNVGSSVGIAEFLNKETSIEKVIRKTAVPNLYLLSAGKNRTSATEKFLEANLSDMFNHLHRWFDYIIVDTPPVAPVIDAHIISPHCDATLFVLRHGKTPKKILQLLNDEGKISTMKNVFIVFNGVKARGMIKSDYGYGYGSGYEYAYSSDE